MKRFVRIISIILVAVLLLSVPAMAAEDTRSSRYIMSTCVYLHQTTSNQFRIWHEVIALGIMDKLGASTIYVQESTDGNSWSTVWTYTSRGYPHMVAENDYFYTNYVTYLGTAGLYYRARITLFAEDSTGRGEVTVYTDVLKL